MYRGYFKKFNANDCEEVIQFVPNDEAEAFLLENAPRLYCPDPIIEETFAFRTWTMRKHIKNTEDGFVITEFLVNDQLPWAGKHNTINAPLTHHLNEFRWLKNANDFLDYITFLIKGDGSVAGSRSAFAYHTPALSAMYSYCVFTANEDYLAENAAYFETYFNHWEQTHLTPNGLFWSNDDREGTEYSVSGTTSELRRLVGFRPLLNACMYGDAVSLAKIFRLVGNSQKEQFYLERARSIKKCMDEKMWDGEFYKAIHPLEQDLDKELDFRDIPEECNVRELVGYIPWVFHMPDPGKEEIFSYLKDPKTFLAKTGLATADISHPRFEFYLKKACTWCGNVWPYATSYALDAVIELLTGYDQHTLDYTDLYCMIKQYADMHYAEEDGKVINFIDEVMLPFEHVWYARELAKAGKEKLHGGQTRGRDYNHSTFIDLVLRGLCGIRPDAPVLTVKPKLRGIWKWFKVENLTYRGETYDVYYDEDGTAFGRGIGVVIEKRS